eukprot:315316-Chlamydomonas_euryale.AAC.5
MWARLRDDLVAAIRGGHWLLLLNAHMAPGLVRRQRRLQGGVRDVACAGVGACGARTGTAAAAVARGRAGRRVRGCGRVRVGTNVAPERVRWQWRHVPTPMLAKQLMRRCAPCGHLQKPLVLLLLPLLAPTPALPCSCQSCSTYCRHSTTKCCSR